MHARGWGPIHCPVHQLGVSTVPNLVRKAWRTSEERLVFSCVGRLKELGTKASKARWQQPCTQQQGEKSSRHNSPRPSFLELSLCRCRTLWGEAPLLGYSFLETSLQTHPEACQLIPDPIRLAINTKCKRICITLPGNARY